MPRRSPARYLAPVALIVFALALLGVVTGSAGDGDVAANGATSDAPADGGSSETTATGDDGGESASAAGGDEEATEDETAPRGPRFYRVQPGDTPGTIAEKTGVPLERLESLNPDIDPQALTPGQRLRLRR